MSMPDQAAPIACANTFALGHPTDFAAHEWLTLRPIKGMGTMPMGMGSMAP